MEGQRLPMEADMMNGVLDVNSSPGKRPATSKGADRPNRQRHFSRPVGPRMADQVTANAAKVAFHVLELLDLQRS